MGTVLGVSRRFWGGISDLLGGRLGLRIRGFLPQITIFNRTNFRIISVHNGGVRLYSNLSSVTLLSDLKNTDREFWHRALFLCQSWFKAYRWHNVWVVLQLPRASRFWVGRNRSQPTFQSLQQMLQQIPADAASLQAHED